MGEVGIAVIGGSGLYYMEGLEDVQSLEMETPFGAPSGPVTIGTIDGVRVVFLPRHGLGHYLLPSEVPYQANIYALKSLGVERVISVSAVGSLQEGIAPLDMVTPTQIIDRTRGHRTSSFFGNGIVAHVGFADPFCPTQNTLLAEAVESSGGKVHRSGTYLVIEGPHFSTRAESAFYRSLGASVIGMTVLPEAKLAREAEMCYSTLACVTDYDVWHETEEEVSVELVVENLKRNIARAKDVLRAIIPQLTGPRTCSCGNALAGAIITDPRVIPDATRKKLGPVIARYLA